MRKKVLPFSFFYFLILTGCKTQIRSQDTFYLFQVVTDSLFESKQKIHLLFVKNNPDYLIDVGYSKSGLLKTSDIAKKKQSYCCDKRKFF